MKKLLLLLFLIPNLVMAESRPYYSVQLIEDNEGLMLLDNETYTGVRILYDSNGIAQGTTYYEKGFYKGFEFNNLEDERCKKPCIFRRIDYYVGSPVTQKVYDEMEKVEGKKFRNEVVMEFMDERNTSYVHWLSNSYTTYKIGKNGEVIYPLEKEFTFTFNGDSTFKYNHKNKTTKKLNY